jgi:hypothetical protein
MALLIPTSELPAIELPLPPGAVPLKHLHTREILYLDDEIDTTMTGKHPNGGFARICLEVKNGVLGLIEFIKTSKPENRQPTE